MCTLLLCWLRPGLDMLNITSRESFNHYFVLVAILLVILGCSYCGSMKKSAFSMSDLLVILWISIFFYPHRLVWNDLVVFNQVVLFVGVWVWIPCVSLKPCIRDLAAILCRDLLWILFMSWWVGWEVTWWCGMFFQNFLYSYTWYVIIHAHFGADQTWVCWKHIVPGKV